MRIVHLSDVHLNKENLESLKLYYMSKLIADLKVVHQSKPIDILLITGDLVDRGGSSLGDDCYSVFEQEFIEPICNCLALEKSNVLFIPGNHDIQRELIEKNSEFLMSQQMNSEMANKYLVENLVFRDENRRIQKFKEFERRFHSSHSAYESSNNESIAHFQLDGHKVGFILVNDSWRCSNMLEKSQHFFGYEQLLMGIKKLKEKGCVMNIAVFHHPFEAFSTEEMENLEAVCMSEDIEIAFFGHSHKYSSRSIHADTGGFISIRGRAVFNNPNEELAKFQPGYCTVDIDLGNSDYTIRARKFIKTGYRFDADVDALKGGEYSGRLVPKPNIVPLSFDKTAPQEILPNGYTADVSQIVRLLIGKSLYSQPFICIRELIQNSVDACNRLSETVDGSKPVITMKVNTKENYFEIMDEGDGMTAKVLKEQFAVIGKSISQVYNEAAGNRNLISQFGIGFISTFIIAKRVTISTRSLSEDQIDFEVSDVFKGFNYSYRGDRIPTSGTRVRVYLKEKYLAGHAFVHAKRFCRHVPNINFFTDEVAQKYAMGWNVENGIAPWEDSNSRFEIKLTISQSPRAFVASNCGFLISNSAPAITPLFFPAIIGGEINFQPRAIDLDMARGSIIESDKALDIRREISSSLRVLFRQALEGNDVTLKRQVIEYLQFYYYQFEHLQNQIETSYIDFYSKRELLDLCLIHSRYHYAGGERSLGDIVDSLQDKGKKVIYFTATSSSGEYKTLLEQSVLGLDNFIVRLGTKTISFHPNMGSAQYSIQGFLEKLANDLGFELMNLDTLSLKNIANLSVVDDLTPGKMRTQIMEIKTRIRENIYIGKFNNDSIGAIRYKGDFYLNLNYPGINTLLQQEETLGEEIIRAYLCGIMDIPLI